MHSAALRSVVAFRWTGNQSRRGCIVREGAAATVAMVRVGGDSETLDGNQVCTQRPAAGGRGRLPGWRTTPSFRVDCPAIHGWRETRRPSSPIERGVDRDTWRPRRKRDGGQGHVVFEPAWRCNPPRRCTPSLSSGTRPPLLSTCPRRLQSASLLL